MKPSGRIKLRPEDFVVVELPAYEPSGAGDHLFVRFTKTGRTTADAVEALARGARVLARDVGVAGLKDKVAVTTQTVSLPVPKDRPTFDADVASLQIPGVVIEEVKRHGNKLRTGHLRGNRFEVVVRGIDPTLVVEVEESLARVGREGVPNAFGAQRFGRDKDNADQAMAWLTGRIQGPRDPRKKRFLWSALQSELFNTVLGLRVAEGTWRTPLTGDVLKKTDTGGLFLCEDEDEARERADRGLVSPTGPMFGTKMVAATGHPGELERRVIHERLGPEFDLTRTKPYGEGTRRDLCLRAEALTLRRVDGTVKRDPQKDEASREEGAGLAVAFVLPKGAYATTVLGSVLELIEINNHDEGRTDVSLQD